MQAARVSRWRLVPPGLIGLRLVVGPVMLLGAVAGWPGWLLVVMLAAGILSDIFDGVIARRIGTATVALRQADSAADVVFWAFVAAAAEICSPGFIGNHAWLLGGLLACEVICQGISFAKFQRLLATHAYAAKLWGLLLGVGFAVLLIRAQADVFIDLILGFGFLIYAEIFAVVLASKTHPVDVKSVFHVMASKTD